MNKLNNINSKQDHILACLSSAPSNAKIIRSAARMAKAFDSQFTALFVETPDFAVATDENKKRLEENRKLAEQLGATIETVYGDDIPYQIAEFAPHLRYYSNCFGPKLRYPKASVWKTDINTTSVVLCTRAGYSYHSR